MQQWEYLFVSFEPRKPKPDQEPDWYLSYASNQRVPRESAPTIQVYTNQLGAEGWQLFHCHYALRSTKSTLLRMIFKRPVEGQSAVGRWDSPVE